MVHGLRRAAEMEEVVKTLDALGTGIGDDARDGRAATGARRAGAGRAGDKLDRQARRAARTRKRFTRRNKPHDADHRLPRPLHHRAGARMTTGAMRRRPRSRPARRPRPIRHISDDEIRETIEEEPASSPVAERGADMTIFSPRASAMAPHVGDESVSLAWARVSQRSDRARVSISTPRPSPAYACCRKRPRRIMSAGSIAELERCVGELGFIGCNLNPDPGGGHFTFPAAHRPLLVSVLREDGRARRAGDDPRLGQLQSGAARDRRLLHRRRHHRLHAVDRRRSVQGFPDRCASSSRMAAARCPIIGGAIAASPTCSSSRASTRI
jgi:hypothetical protein